MKASPPAADATETVLLALCRGPVDAAALQAVDWSRLVELAALHGVAGQVWHSLTAQDALQTVPQPAQNHLQAAVQQVHFDGMIHLREMALVTAALVAAGLEPIWLKGHALADLLYDDPLIRPSGDLDVLVRPAEVAAAEAALLAVGYQAQSAALHDYELAHNYHVTLLREVLPGRAVLLELHWDLGAVGLFRYDLAAWRAAAQRFTLVGVDLPLHRFAPDAQLLHLALHMRKHRYVGLRWLIDVATLLRRFDASLDWPALAAAARQGGFATLLYTTVTLAHSLFAAPLPVGWPLGLAPSPVRRRLLHSVLTQNALLAPVETADEGWTRLAPAEVLLLDKPSVMARELLRRLAPPVEKLAGPEAAALSRSQRLALRTRRLLRRTRTLISDGASKE